MLFFRATALSFLAICLGFTSPLVGAENDRNLVTNGDFEAGTLQGWHSVRGAMEVVRSDVARHEGVTEGQTGAWVVTSGQGPNQEEIGQDVDLSDLDTKLMPALRPSTSPRWCSPDVPAVSSISAPLR